MQSSGASLFTYFLAQRPGSIAITDLWPASLCPPLESDRDVVVKCVVTTSFSLQDHARSFLPHATILFLRNPAANFASLVRHPYRDDGGLIDEKFRALDRAFAERDRYSAVVRFEDFVTRSAGALSGIAEFWPLDASYYELSRDPVEVARSCLDLCPPGLEWGFGNVHGRSIDAAAAEASPAVDVRRHVASLCPALSDAYG